MRVAARARLRAWADNAKIKYIIGESKGGDGGTAKQSQGRVFGERMDSFRAATQTRNTGHVLQNIGEKERNCTQGQNPISDPIAKRANSGSLELLGVLIMLVSFSLHILARL